MPSAFTLCVPYGQSLAWGALVHSTPLPKAWRSTASGVNARAGGTPFRAASEAKTTGRAGPMGGNAAAPVNDNGSH